MNGEEMRKLRDDRGLTRAEFGKELGVSQWTIQKWEQGVNAIPKAIERNLMSSIKAAVDVTDLAEIVEISRRRGEEVEETIKFLIRQGLKAVSEKR